MSGDFRLKDVAAYEQWYAHRHPCPERLRGLRLRPAGAEPGADPRRPASWPRPGCFATTIELALLPLARAGLLEGVVHVQGITGSSGSGVAPSRPAPTTRSAPATSAPTSRSSTSTCPRSPRRWPRPARRDLALRFVPVSAPLARGILATAFVELPEEWTQERLDALYRETYAGEPFVRVPRKRLPEVAAVSGSNYAEVGVAAGPPRGGRRTVTFFGAHRQPGQGRRRAGHPEHEPHARARREGLARRPGALAAMKTIVIKLGGRDRPAPELDLIAARPARARRRVPPRGDRARRRAAGERAAEAARARDADDRRPPLHRRRDAGGDEVRRRRPAQRRPLRAAAGARRDAGGAARRRAATWSRPRGARRGSCRARGRSRSTSGWSATSPASTWRCSATCFERRYVPVLACLGCDADGPGAQHQRRHRGEPAGRRARAPTRSCSSPRPPACCAT